MAAYSVVVSTFLRPLKLEQCLDALTQIPTADAPEMVVVADDGESHKEKDRVYNIYVDELPLIVVDLPFDAGLSRKRNAGIERVDTEYVLLLDDDQYVPSNIQGLTTFLDAHPDIGAIAPFWEERGVLKCNAANYRHSRGWVLKDTHDSHCERAKTGDAFYRYDHIPNAAMFRTAVFDEYSWDEAYVIAGEDTDFYLRHHNLGEWEFAVTPDYVLRHDPGPGTVEAYATERKDTEKIDASLNHLTQKFGIRGVLQLDSHHHPDRSTRSKLVYLIARTLVPNTVLWKLRRRDLGFYIEQKLLPDQA